MRLTLLLYFLFFGLWLFFIVFLFFVFITSNVSLVMSIVFVVLASLPMLIATLTRFHLVVCVFITLIWWIVWGFGFFGSGDNTATGFGLLILLAWWLGVPLFWLIPAIAGREVRGKTESYEIEYPEYIIRKQ